MRILAIDPGTTESALVCWDGVKIIGFTKTLNNCILNQLRENDQDYPLVIEEINPYTMGMTIRDTILWSGRFQEARESRYFKVDYIPRREVTGHLCGAKSKVGDSVVIQALRDRFAYGVSNYGKGTKAAPGFFYGFKSDIWQAFALAVTYFDQSKWRDE